MLSSSCGAVKNETVSAPVDHKVAPHGKANKDMLHDVNKLYNAEGFVIPCLKSATIAEPKTTIENVSAKNNIFRIIYSPNNCELKDFDIYERLVGFPKYDREVRSIIGYGTETKAFEYVVSFNIKPTNAITELTYLDTDRDGRFDTVFQSTSLMKPIIPDWLQKPE